MKRMFTRIIHLQSSKWLRGGGNRRQINKILPYSKSRLVVEASLFVLGSSAATYYVGRWIERNEEEFYYDSSSYAFRRTFYDVFQRFPRKTDAYLAVVAVNALVFCCWQTRSFVPFMQKYFLCNFTKGSSVASMFFANFSHLHILHIGINMYVLNNFASVTLGQESIGETFIIYTVGGILGCYISGIRRFLLGISVGSMGASAALLSIIGHFVALNPNARLNILGFNLIYEEGFKPMPFFGYYMIAEFLAILFLRNSQIDHTAHLAGALFGYVYGKWKDQTARTQQERNYWVPW